MTDQVQCSTVRITVEHADSAVSFTVPAHFNNEEEYVECDGCNWQVDNINQPSGSGHP